MVRGAKSPSENHSLDAAAKAALHPIALPGYRVPEPSPAATAGCCRLYALGAMDLSEYPLLNRPALMLLVLKAAGEHPVTQRDCRARLAADLDRIHERPDVPERVIAAELDEVGKHLEAARLVTRDGNGAFSLTARGRQVLAEHPFGVDETVLASFAEYRTFIAAFARRKTVDDPRPSRYDEGHAAQQEGCSLSENPYPPDSVDHLAWENGWSEARDTDVERRR